MASSTPAPWLAGIAMVVGCAGPAERSPPVVIVNAPAETAVATAAPPGPTGLPPAPEPPEVRPFPRPEDHIESGEQWLASRGVSPSRVPCKCGDCFEVRVGHEAKEAMLCELSMDSWGLARGEGWALVVAEDGKARVAWQLPTALNTGLQMGGPPLVHGTHHVKLEAEQSADRSTVTVREHPDANCTNRSNYDEKTRARDPKYARDVERFIAKICESPGTYVWKGETLVRE